jgi:hypothetical protein
MPLMRPTAETSNVLWPHTRDSERRSEEPVLPPWPDRSTCFHRLPRSMRSIANRYPARTARRCTCRANTQGAAQQNRETYSSTMSLTHFPQYPWSSDSKYATKHLPPHNAEFFCPIRAGSQGILKNYSWAHETAATNRLTIRRPNFESFVPSAGPAQIRHSGSGLGATDTQEHVDARTLRWPREVWSVEELILGPSQHVIVLGATTAGAQTCTRGKRRCNRVLATSLR